MELRFRGIETAEVEGLRAGELDANGQKPLLQAGAGVGPCRQCLAIIQEDEEKLILAYRPFASLHPYAETGPIFLHGSGHGSERGSPHGPGCTRYDAGHPPAWFEFLEPAIVRGYDRNDWIRYDTGAAVAGRDLAAVSKSILSDETVAYVHVRSKFGCFQCRVDRA
jgi:hypothetical protein